ncbi:MAG: alpha/beta hydrolase [Solirubrobacterales bacterium]|nr:alpha/beta hydrolase [Solirubrobacterales bacterium]
MTRTRLILDFLTRGRSYRYGPHRSQRADLYLPVGAGPHPVMIMIHGGSWHKRYGKVVMRGLAGDLIRQGWAVWNIEYRRLGEGGGWPATFEDVAAAIDHLWELDAPLDLDSVSVLGHSAGGHLALWAAGRPSIAVGEPGAEPAIELKRAISQAGVCDLAGAYRMWRGGAAGALMGGSPQDVPDRYAVGDALALAPVAMPVLLVHGLLDRTVSIELSRTYERESSAAGAAVELIEIDGEAGGHRAHVDPRGAAWAAVAGWLREPLRV